MSIKAFVFELLQTKSVGVSAGISAGATVTSFVATAVPFFQIGGAAVAMIAGYYTIKLARRNLRDRRDTRHRDD